MQKEENKFLAYQVLRYAMGVNLVAHGLVRFPKLSSFAQWMVEASASLPIPDFFVRMFGYGLPVIEFIAGVLLILGFFPRVGLLLWGACIVILSFATCMMEEWNTATSLIIYALVTYFLLRGSEYARPLFSSRCSCAKKKE